MLSFASNKSNTNTKWFYRFYFVWKLVNSVAKYQELKHARFSLKYAKPATLPGAAKCQIPLCSILSDSIDNIDGGRLSPITIFVQFEISKKV